MLGKMERLFEGLVDGIFGRGADSLPAGILRHLADAIEREAVTRGGKRWAPSDCRILLTREAMRLVLPIQAALEEELRMALARLANQAGLHFSSPLRFRYAVGDGDGVALLGTKVSFVTPPPEEDKEAAVEGGGTAPTKIFRRAAGKPSRRAWLRVEAGPDTGREFQLMQGRTIIGRHAANHVILTDPNVSRQHAAIVFEHGGYDLVDLGSTNGTFLNGKLSMRRRLRNEDRIKIGQTVLVFHHQRVP
ncbi:MAG: FhaA domain-containing protein [Bacteroidota bacterium]